MKSGICYPSYARSTTWAIGAGSNAMDPDFPIQNLSAIDQPAKVARQAAPGGQNLYFDLGGIRSVDFLAVVNHNAPAGGIFSVTLYAGANQTGGTVHATGNLQFTADSNAFTRVRPIRLPAPVMAGSGVIVLPVNPVAWEIGAVEIGRFWEWNVEVPRGIGIDSRSTVTESAGVAHVTKQWGPRIFTGERELIAQEEVDTTFLDFQRDMGLSKAFVWCSAVDDPDTWAREAVLVTNNALPAAASPEYDVGRMGFSFREHLR